ncbi:MAG: FUSC family protein [Alphaproteobacteria bacterium]|nr:MAG: FUSC family protein [Alphaproteobacteria bacterium]
MTSGCIGLNNPSSMGYYPLVMTSFAALTQYRPQLRQCVRVTAAALVAYAVNLYFEFQQGYWIAFTAIIIVQANLGGSLRAAFERMTGTLAGAAYGALVITLMPHETQPLFALTVILGLAPAGFAAAVSPMFRIAPITVAIMLFGNLAPDMPPVVFAEHRVAEIGMGCLIGLAMSVLVAPSRAHGVLAAGIAGILKQYADLLSIQAGMAVRATEQAPVDERHAAIRNAISRLDVTGDEARRERKSRLTGDPDPEPLLRMVRRIRNDLVMIGRAVMRPLPDAAQSSLREPFSRVTAAAGELFTALAAALPGRKTVAMPPGLDASFEAFAAAMSALHQRHALNALPESDTGRIFTLGFALEQLRQNLNDLVARANEFIKDDANG